ncbi:uncharacterized protein B0I36DRAFT_355924 [Microdochium trichocladiopsis]|uniref:Uncharacterized protein n=1 Tax=Microdochium trichocladiopsis TaxID=1682393 RepID=A0A9P8XRB0_9PEZI|nr:uncharacterized protein B0I36DRAFT_355924 [Microdochium trichocladiopsis]KAH7012528.1 hypothetical protein B0I36DRAFT_355924 [Microdochium trichocladiopsis]
MSRAVDAGATVSVGTVLAMGDNELAQFMQNNYKDDRNYDLPIDGWKELSDDERNDLAQRLNLAQSNNASSHPLDLDDLNLRLLQLLPNDSSNVRSKPLITRSTRSTSDDSLTDSNSYKTTDEINAYNDLVSDGGRPLYSIDIIQDVYMDPGNEHLTQTSPSGVFQRQLRNWQGFRRWQRHNRDREDSDDGSFLAYVERVKRHIRQDPLHRAPAQRLAQIEADPSFLQPTWLAQQCRRNLERRSLKEAGCEGFHAYVEAVRSRLARYGFAQTVTLKEASEDQDHLMTWIEYLNYQYWWLDKSIAKAESLEPGYQKLWNELVEKGILKAHETDDYG